MAERSVRELLDRLERHYEFTDALGHPLRLCAEWQELKATVLKDAKPKNKTH